ncbi:hypothetical protein LTR22_024488 [Elasticomyces elasticus]|nr:hypothetical protein LTR22_024488 [Elasticomyces elasticus]KAK5743203.1 hypothetical protein LTS12_023932 [Elasticomyces elasticus]
MEASVSSQNNAASVAPVDDSDYGSDLDEATIDALFSPPVDDVEQPVILDDHGDGRKSVVRLARTRGSASQASTATSQADTSKRAREPSIEIEYDESNRRTFSPPPEDVAQQQRRRERSAPLETDGPPDTRSPLLRFRTPPKKGLSVTDLVSPAWCELQYFYSLSRYGRVRRTPAMKAGSSVHKVLEEQVHTEVPVEVVTKEDRFGLRIWNVVQGLRTLRRTGMTRELEVWGVIEGETLNGIIDQVTTVCPDEEAEAKMLLEIETAAHNGIKKTKEKHLPPDQRTLGQYFGNNTFESQNSSTLESRHGGGWLGTLHSETEPAKKLYIVDVKTRQSKSLPAHGSQTRPTYYQLMLYHRLFSALAANEVPAERVFERYQVDAKAQFSDSFIAQIGTSGVGFEDDGGAMDQWAGADADMDRGGDDLETLLTHNTNEKLWIFMISEFARTVPSTASVSPLLTAEFRSGSSGSLLGRRHFSHTSSELDAYVQDELSWWRGERPAKGVQIEEAFKCGYCEFAEGCEWRASKVEEGVKKMRLRKEKGRKSEV